VTDELVKFTVRLDMGIAACCRLCHVRSSMGERFWCISWPGVVVALEVYCQDCYGYLHTQQGLDKLHFPDPRTSINKQLAYNWELFMAKSCLSPTVPRLRPFWVKKEELDGFRKFNEALKGGFGVETD